MQMLPLLIITCDEPPVPPFRGHNRVIYEVIQALRESHEIHALMYPTDQTQWESLKAHWKDKGVNCHPLRRRLSGRHCRAVLNRLSLPTVTRDFLAETELTRKLVRGRENARLLIDFISGAPLLRWFHGSGTVLSGHDCMSYLFQEEGRFACGHKKRFHFWLRRCFALNTERLFAHRAAKVHLVSSQDAVELQRVNPKINPAVIPLGREQPDPAILHPIEHRWRLLIWGSLRSELIVTGLRHLFDTAVQMAPRGLRGWTLLGRVPEREARAVLPQLATLGVNYQAEVDDLPLWLGQTRALLLPDISGTGQKTRTLDGIAHGCCVLGLGEVFRGFEADGAKAYFSADNYKELATMASQVDVLATRVISHAAQELFVRQFSRPALARQWDNLLSSVGTLPLT